jgi:hypothetical protein
MLLCLGYLLNAQVSKTVAVTTAGTLTTLLTANEKTTVTNLTVTGNINARDVKCMRDEMTVLAVVDMVGANIVTYNGSMGTYSGSYNYPANEMPYYSFCNSYSYISKKSLKNITLPSSLTSIGASAFRSCTGLTSITLPNSVTSIGSFAFSNCNGLTSITLPSSLTTISSSAFSGCDGLTTITLPSSLTTISNSAFSNCYELTSITLPSSLTSIGDYAFTYMNFITCLGSTPATLGTVSLGSPLAVYVPAEAVATYKAATGWSSYNIVVEKQVTINNPTAGGLADAIIGGGHGPLSSITHLTVTGNLNAIDIGQMKTNMTNLTAIDLSGVSLANNALPDYAFQDKAMLSSIVLPSTVVSIGNNAFSGCTLSGPIPLPASVTTIGSSAFSGCIRLTGALTIPNSVTLIGADAFHSCSGFTGALTIPNSVTSIGDYAFSGCSGLTGALPIPNSLTSIGSGAFYGCSGLTGELTIPNSVTSIGSRAFDGCSGFNGPLTLSNSATYLAYYAFSGCSQISGTLTIPTSVTIIDPGAFYGCKSITELTIPASTTNISSNAFGGCTGLQKITVARHLPPTIDDKTFTGVNKESCALVVPFGSSSTYKTTAYWSEFKNISEAGITGIEHMQTISAVKVYTANQSIVVVGAEQGPTVTVYHSNGGWLQSVVSQGDKVILPVKAGAIYLVKVGEQTFKVVL